MFQTPCADAQARPTFEVERELIASGYSAVIGVDEVGRGALAGPVTVGLYVLTGKQLESAPPEGLTDSKLLTPARRERMESQVREWAELSAIASATNEEIDRWGLSQALSLAVSRGLASLYTSCHEEHQVAQACQSHEEADHGDRLHADPGAGHHVLGCERVAILLDGPFDYITRGIAAHSGDGIDGLELPFARLAQEQQWHLPTVFTLVKADRRSLSVAGASVLAKVSRDRYMCELAQQHPACEQYGWSKNKGYGSPAHRSAIQQLGVTPWHRSSWNLTQQRPRTRRLFTVSDQ